MKKPTVFGKYLLLERVNVGGMAEVFVAKSYGVEGFERVLAIKRILPTMAEDEEFIGMFIDEARISAELTHTNVVHIFELGKQDNSYYLAMEYVSGKDVRAVQEYYRGKQRGMPVAQAAYIAAKMCEGLDYAHRKRDARGAELNIVHRDVSPQNILLSYEGEVKIIDFGIAKASNRSQHTEAGILKGKFGYMSPEQVQGRPIDRRSDIFAAGVLLYEMLTGERLFTGESDFSTLEKVRAAVVPTPSKLNPDIPPELERVMLKALAREPDDRYAWASDLQEDLQQFLVEGDALFSAKQLSAFLKEAFAEDVLREAERLERFAKIERPDQLENSTLNAAAPKRSGLSWPMAPAPPAPAPDPDDVGKTQIVSSGGFEAVLESARVSQPGQRRASPSGGSRKVTGGGEGLAHPGNSHSGAVHAPATTSLPPPVSKPSGSFEGLARPPASVTRLRPVSADDEDEATLFEAQNEVVSTSEHLAPRSGSRRVRTPATPSGRVEVREVRSSAVTARGWPQVVGVVVVIVALALVGFLAHRFLHPAQVELVVTATPLDSAVVTVRGRPVRNNASLFLPPGDYEVTASAPGYNTWREVVRLTPEKTLVAVQPELTRAAPTPSPSSPVAPATVGAPEVTAKEPATPAPSTGSPQATRGSPGGSVQPDSLPPSFTAKFDVSEPGVAITVEGEPAGTTPGVQFTGVSGKRYHYTARKPGFREVNKSFVAKGPGELTVHVALERVVEHHASRPKEKKAEVVVVPATSHPTRFGELWCSSNPAGAHIWVDNKDTGQTTPASAAHPVRLPVGHHTVVFKLEGRKSEPQAVEIPENKEARVINIPLQ
jgi:serine/threonine protein kinase